MALSGVRSALHTVLFAPRLSTRTLSRTTGAVLLAGGAAHFVAPKAYEPLIPRELPGSARSWILGSGVAEAAIGAGLLVPQTRHVSAIAATAAFVGIFPGNVQAVRSLKNKPALQAVAIARLPLQIPLVTLAYRLVRETA